jgi:hypothetical protein
MIAHFYKKALLPEQTSTDVTSLSYRRHRHNNRFYRHLITSNSNGILKFWSCLKTSQVDWHEDGKSINISHYFTFKNGNSYEMTTIKALWYDIHSSQDTNVSFIIVSKHDTVYRCSALIEERRLRDALIKNV